MVNIFPDININEESKNTITPSKVGRCFLFDFETGKYKVQNGKMVECTNKEAVEQWIKLLILTRAEKFRVYKGISFGLKDFYNLKGRNIASDVYMQGEVKRELKDKIEAHVFVKTVSEVSLSFEAEKMNIKLSVILEDGTNLDSEVII